MCWKMVLAAHVIDMFGVEYMMIYDFKNYVLANLIVVYIGSILCLPAEFQTGISDNPQDIHLRWTTCIKHGPVTFLYLVTFFKSVAFPPLTHRACLEK